MLPTHLQLRASPERRSSLPLELRRLREGVVLLRASNDTAVDGHGTVITVEALHDWWEGYQQHRTINLQHGIDELRGIAGRPMVGVATRVDFTPQLEVEVRVIDPAAWRLIEQGAIAGGSLEFVPADSYQQHVEGREAVVYTRLSSEPELTGLSLVDIPSVPGADILALRSLLPNWAYAVIDPRVLMGEITEPALIDSLRWLPHHDLSTRLTTHEMLERAYAEIENIAVPAEGSLSREQIIRRAREHLDRHRRLGLGMRARHMEVNVNRWIRSRTEQYQAEGLSAEQAAARAAADYQALTPEIRTRIEGSTPGGSSAPAAGQQAQQVAVQAGQRVEPQWDEAHRRFVPVVVNVNHSQPLDQRTDQQGAQTAQPSAAAQQTSQAAQGQQDGTQQDDLDRRVQQAMDTRIQAMMRQPENPMAAIAAGLQVRSQRLDPEQLLSAVLAATVLPRLQQRALDPNEIQRVHNMLRAHGISERSLSIEGSGTVIYQELARQFVVRPAPDIVFRNHMRTLPMGGSRRVDFPRFSRAGLTFQWNRSSAVGAGSFADITTSSPSLDTFPIEVTELNGAVPVADGFLHFNTSGPVFVQEYLLPELRSAAQFEEDRVFFLSTGTHPLPATFRGLRNVVGATAVAAGANGDPFTEAMLDGLLRAMPTIFREDPRRLAFYLPVARADDLLELRTSRVSALGDRILEQDANVPGPLPVARHRGVNVYSVPQLPTTETQGTSTDASTIYLVHRDQPVIGDALTIRIEPYRRSGFQTLIQLQEFVGLGYQWPESVVRRNGVRPRA